MGHSEFYHSKAWRKKRAKILRRDKHLCRESLRYGKRVDATTVHHIFPLEQYPELALEDWNLVSLSTERHDAMHDRKTGAVTELGRQWQRRVSPHPLALGNQGKGDRAMELFPIERDF